jgi:hypothetical protein
MKHRMRITATASAFLFFVFALHSPSSAQTDAVLVSTDAAQSLEAAPENKKCATFSCVDTDKNNSVSREELTDYADPSLAFDDIDKDDDGSLSPDEWNNRDEPPPPSGS